MSSLSPIKANQQRVTTASGKKPNPQSVSSTDCHTCKSQGRRCDRQRPQCATCTSHVEKCGGFETPLQWDRGSKSSSTQSKHGRDVERTTTRSKRSSNLAGATNSEADPVTFAHPAPPASVDAPASLRKFTFVDSRKPKRRKRFDSRVGNGKGTSRETHEEVNPERQDSHPSIPIVSKDSILSEIEDVSNGGEYVVEDPPVTQHSFPELLPSTMWPIDSQMEAFLNANSFQDLDPFGGAIQDNLSLLSPGRGATGNDGADALSNDSWLFKMTFNGGTTPNDQLNIAMPDFSNSIPAPMSREAIRSTFQINADDLLERYDREFCVLPLTSDTPDVGMNPFRCREQTSRGSRLLLHAILALCYNHMNHNNGSWIIEAMEHKSTAHHLLEGATRIDSAAEIDSANESGVAQELGILDTILILFTLDCTNSALGAWTTHLTRARQVLEACGGPTSLQTPRVQSQVGMLIWWDATLALVSRQELVMPEKYLTYILDNTRNGTWTFYDLSGCPQELFTWLVQLARFAREKEIVMSMEWATFNMTPVLEAETVIKQWKSPGFADKCSISALDEGGELDGDEDKYQFQQDAYHCAEAWRYALLLYIERVFKWDRASTPSITLGKYVRSALDHIRCCQRSSLIRKQLLLPVFLAGSETTESDSRDMVRSYCDWWAEKSRYKMFHTVSILLEEIWQDPSHTWWGSAVDQKTKHSRSAQEPINFLLG